MKKTLTRKEIKDVERRMFDAIVERNGLRHVAGMIYFDPKEGRACIPYVNVDDLTAAVAKAQHAKIAE
jgi:hypothetical protein